MFLHSCAGIKVKPETVEEVKKKFQGICLHGDGRGRVQFLTQGYSFAFESLLESKKKKWSLGLHLPLYGEEIIRLDYADAQSGNVRISGAFYNRLRTSGKSSSGNQYYVGLLRKFLGKYGQFLSFITSGDKDFLKKCHGNVSDGVCPMGGDELSYVSRGETLKLGIRVDSEHTFFIYFSEFEKKFFHRIRLYFNNPQKGGMERRPIQMDMILNSCESE